MVKCKVPAFLLALLALLAFHGINGAETHVSGMITTDTTWTLDGSPYIITGFVQVQGENGPFGATLTIEPGVEVRFNLDAGLNVGTNWYPWGRLVADGNAGPKPGRIVFTSNSPTPAVGDWYWVRITDFSTAILRNVHFAYGSQCLSVDSFLHAGDCSGLFFDNCDIAVNATHPSSGLTITKSEIVGVSWALKVIPGTFVDARGNWWGAADGPSGVAPGSGSAINYDEDGVFYEGFLDAPIADCDADGVSDSCEVDCGLAGGPCDIPGCGEDTECEILDMKVNDTTMLWTDVPFSTGYDVVEGDLQLLRSSAGDFASAVPNCLADDYPVNSLPLGSDPNAGQVLFFLARVVTDTGPHGYNGAGLSQVEPRDAEIQASGVACP